MGTPERDIYLTGRLIGGLPTCTFPAAGYSRTITNIVVGNSATSNVKCYRGLLGSTPVAQNLLGSSNTLRGRLPLPAGQQFFVQWSAVGTSVADAFARISSERDDSPLEAGSSGHTWDTDAITSLTLPNTAGPNEAAIIIGSDLPSCMQSAFAAAIFERSENVTVTGHSSRFMAVEKASAGFTSSGFVEGYYFTDGSSCGYIVTRREVTTWASVGTPDFHNQQFGISSAVGTLPFGTPAGRKMAYSVFLYLAGVSEADSSFQFVGPNDSSKCAVSFTNLRAVDFNGVATIELANSKLQVDTTTPIVIDNVSAPRGLKDRVSSVAGTGAIGAEAIVLTGNSFTWVAGRAYVVRYLQETAGSIANNYALFQIRRTNLAGAVKNTAAFQMNATAGVTERCFDRVIIRNATGADITDLIVLTMASGGGGTVTGAGAAAVVRYLEVRDIGASADYGNAIQI